MAPRRRKEAKASSILSIWTVLATTASALNFTAITLPTIRTEDYGRMGLVGDFQSIALYEYSEQGGQTYYKNGSHAVITQLPNGELATVAVANGHINDMCLFTLTDGTLAGLVVGGNFTTFGGVPAEGLALLNPSDGTPIQLTGLSGSVNALLCDQDTQTVYIGGEFSAANSTNAIAWYAMEGWQTFPFEGFNGPVETISRMPNGTVIFGGRFSALTNSSLISNPNGTDKITQQVINLDTATITATLGSTRDGFSNPKNIVCSNGTDQAGEVFLLEDGQLGSWSAELAFTIYPSKLRLYNTHFEDRGVKTFRLVSRPNNGIMNLTSIDPVSNERFYCDAWCPLSHDTNETVPYQDFEFVNVIPTNAFRLEVIEYFGAGAGLTGLELFQDDIYAFADNDLNEPSCKNTDVQTSAQINGTWTSTGGPPTGDSKYLTGVFAGADLDSASVTFRPDIKIPGVYSVLIYTPGCIQDGTCGRRGQVDVSGIFASNQTGPTQATYYQSNEFDKYDTLFTGYVDANSDTFAPEITLRPKPGQEGSITFVASRVRFVLETEFDVEDPTTSNAVSRTRGRFSLNGIFAYNPGVAADDLSLHPTMLINQEGAKLPRNITIKSVAVMDTTVYVAGNVETENFSNILRITPERAEALPSEGLNGAVTDTYLTQNRLYIAGEFNDTANDETAGLSHVAAYDLEANRWVALGSGLNGAPSKIAFLPVNISGTTEDAFAFSGDFTRILATGNAREVEVEGIAIWVPSKNEWLQRLADAPYVIGGYLSQRVEVPDMSPFFAGSLLITHSGLAGGVELVRPPNRPSYELRPISRDIQLTEPEATIDVLSNGKKKRTLDESLGVQPSGIQTSAWYDKANITVIGGRFSIGDTDNLALIYGSQEGRVESLGDNAFAGENFITSLIVTNQKTLYIGGSINTTIGDSRVGGVAIYDFETSAFVQPQPQPLQAEGNRSTVYFITQQPNGRQIYAGGSFTEAAGGFGCPGVCFYDPETFQWFQPGGGFSGVAYTGAWSSADVLVVGGDLRLNDTDVFLATYTVSTTTWTTFTNSSALPGPVTSIFIPNNDETNVFVGGNTDDGAFIYKWDGKTWTNIGDKLLSGSIVHGLEVFELGEGHKSNPIMPENQVLMASGSIRVPGTNVVASAALFDGENWVPFILTTRPDGSSGTLGSFISQNPHNFNQNRGRLAVGLVVLISLAIALGIIFLLVVIGVLASYIRRRREGYMPAPQRTTPAPNPQDMAERLPPDQLFHGVGMGAGRGTPHI